MGKRKIVLASQSPRRKELLSMFLDEFEIIVDNSKEVVRDGATPEETVELLAKQKAENVASRVDYDALVIGADTVVSIDGKIFGKPKDRDDAINMLKTLSGKGNLVCTGVAIVDTVTHKTVCDVVRTEVFFRELTDNEIEQYVASGEPMDKAGAYGMQGIGSLLIRGIRGDYFNVVGLPVCTLNQMLKREFDYNILDIE